MPDTIVSKLTREEVAARRSHMHSAIASARMEGIEIDADARAIMELHNVGEIGDEEMMDRLRGQCLALPDGI